MAAALPPMLSKDELVEAHAKLEQLRVDMATRSAGGREASGRYKKHDTARKVYIDTVAMPSLRLGIGALSDLGIFGSVHVDEDAFRTACAQALRSRQIPVPELFLQRGDLGQSEAIVPLGPSPSA